MNKKILFYIALVFIALLGLAAFFINKNLPFLWQFMFTNNIALKKNDDHINLLLLGTGGGSHDGPNLTDTIIFMSIDQKTNKVNIISIPRDLWVPDLKGKINTAYALGQNNNKHKGLLLAEATVSRILNQPIDYGLRVDFNGFVKAVDLVGGLDISVDRSFDDYAYPIKGKKNDSCGRTPEEIKAMASLSATLSNLQMFPCRYMHIHFNKGLQHMNGEQALEFVRSRHALGPEGTDFARSKRQEKVIKAFRDKIFSAQTLLNPAKIIGLYNTLKNSIDTDIKESEFDDFIRLAEKMKNAQIKTSVLDYGDSATGRLGLLINPPTGEKYDWEWVLIPRKGNGNFSEIQKYVGCEIKYSHCLVTPEGITATSSAKLIR
ncbi:LCP family protein [Patescibacteria group bacterium]|nr:LCP family protein [Patescibacteria group bacterium]MCL5010022.1 LCP family protein [Patescibacteria group bacterium]